MFQSFQKHFSFVHPDGEVKPFEPCGAPCSNVCNIRLRPYTTIDSTKHPTELIAHSAITVFPLSALSTFSACFAPLNASTLQGFCAELKPFLFML